MSHPRVLGVLAGRDMPSGQLAAWASSADVVLAADSGADRLLEIGVVPSETVGDLDSISAEARVAQKGLRWESDQDSSDCDKLLALAEVRGYPAITVACLEGDLLDHVLGSLSSAVRSPLAVRLALRRGVGLVLGPGSFFSEPAKADMRVSLIPLIPCSGVRLTGTEWELKDADLALDGLISLSNIATSPRIEGEIGTGAALLYLGIGPDPIW